MDEMGKAMMGTGEAIGEERAHQAAEQQLIIHCSMTSTMNRAKAFSSTSQAAWT